MSNQTSTQINTPEDTTVTVGDQTQIASLSQDDGGIHAASFVMLDQIIRDGQLSFRKIGSAFDRIKAEKLWKESTTGWTGPASRTVSPALTQTASFRPHTPTR